MVDMETNEDDSSFLPTFRINNLPNNKIEFKEVYDNGIHSLQQFEIENMTQKEIMIQLNSDINDQIFFQLTNENIKDLTVKNIATNTTAWTTLSDATQDFNQVFNYVNHINQIYLLPLQKLQFVIAFLPLSTSNTVVFSVIHGIITFQSKNYIKKVNFEANVCKSILAAADELDTGLIFEDSLIGETYIKDVTIRNQSAITLYWKLNTFDLLLLTTKRSPTSSSNSSNSSVTSHTTAIIEDEWLQFVDATTFITLNHEKPPPILPFSCFTFRVIFTPKEIGKFNYDLQIENINDVDNIIQTKIHATMRNVVHQDTLVVTSGNSLDFGDCIAGSWNIQHIILQNISESPIEIHFVVADSGTEVGFEIMEESAVNEHFPRSHSPTASHKTFESEEFSSTNSCISTDVDNIDMLAAFNEVYSTSTTNVTTTTTTMCNTKIEDMVLKAGVERIIQVSYKPEKDSVNSGQFKRKDFNIILEYRPNKSPQPKEQKLIQCKARTCTSIVQVTPQSIDFGHTDVGTQKSIPITIFNTSDICAQVELVFESKVLNCTQQGDILLQPKSSVELKLDIYPRKVNTCYKRQIVLVNHLNRDNDQIIEVSSTNVDKNKVTFHSLFYRILTPTGANFLDFGPIALNSPAIRTCTLANLRHTSLLLGIDTSSRDEIVIYTKKRGHSLSRKTTTEETQLLASTVTTTCSVTDTLLAKNRKTRLTNVQYTSTAYLDLATVPHTRFSSCTKYKRNIARNVGNNNKLILNHGEKKVTRSCEKKVKKGFNGNITTTTTTKSAMTTTATTAILQKCHNRKKKHKPCVGITGTTQLKKVHSKKIMDWPDIAGKSRVPLDDLISILEYGSLSRTPLFARQSLEEQFVRYQLAWRTELDRLIMKGELVPTTLLHLNPYEEQDIIVVYSPKTSNQSHTSKNTASISFRLIDYDSSAILTTSEEEEEEEGERRYYRNFIPVLRKVIVRAQVCKSIMELGQKNINFGLVDRGEKHHKTIVLHNTSKTPLLYTIKKSGSIASGDIHFGVGRHGVIRAFGKREIEFTFEPTLPGSFMEQLEVLNIRNKEDKNTISLKAMVRRPESFSINKSSFSELNFCCFNEILETLVVTNTTKYPKMFEIQVIHDTPSFKVEFLLDHAYQQHDTFVLSVEEEEEIENLEQKLKIATRKHQLDKVKKYEKRLAKVKRLPKDDVLSEESEETVVATTIIQEDNIIFSCDSNASKTISIHFKMLLQSFSSSSSGRIIIHEHKNIDTLKTLPFSVNICQQHSSL